VEESPETRELSFEDWVELIATSARTEFKPAAKRSVFDHDQFDDTGAGGEGLLWARVIRRTGALLSHVPVVYYDVGDDRRRLTTEAELLARAPANARIARAWLTEVGPTMRTIDRGAWRRLVLAAAVYSAAAGEDTRLAEYDELEPRDRAILGLIRHTPRTVLAGAFRVLKALSR
jgi:hypothetical protein